MRNKKVDKQKKQHYTRMAVLQSALEKEGEKRKKSYYNTRFSYLVTHPITYPNELGLTLMRGRNMLLSFWYCDSTMNAFFSNFYDEKRYQKEKKSL